MGKYNHNLLEIMQTLERWVASGTIQKMHVDNLTNFTIFADESKVHFSYTSDNQNIHSSLKLPQNTIDLTRSS